MKRHISSPALELLRQAQLPPDDLDQALSGLVQARASATLRRNHPLLESIRRATSINVVDVSRRSRYLLMTIEQQKDGEPSWQYREHSPRRCVFSCRGEIPATIEVALNGALLEKLVRPTMALRKTVITHLGATGEGCLNVDVKPTWHSF